MTTQTQIAFTANKKGQPVAYRWSLVQARWFRISLDEAKVLISTGQAREVRFTR